MAYKKISELPEYSGSTTQTWLLINNSGETETFKIQKEDFISGLSNYIEVTYSELVSLINSDSLVRGGYYLITDFQTCYDQPDFDYNGNDISTPETYHTSSIEPLVVLATSENTLSPQAYQPTYPNDRITYDVSWDTTEYTSSPAKGRITERVDEFGNRTDYDHRTILFKRYRSYFEDGTINGRITSMNNGIVTGDINTNFIDDLGIGSVVMIYSNTPQLYEVVEIASSSGMTLSGFNYDNFNDSIGYRCEVMFSNQEFLDGGLYYFNDVGSNDISDGGDDMYDGGNQIYTNLYSTIPYTHTQMTSPPINGSNQASFGDFVYDGSVQSGETYFGVGSNYFTNCYPGLFVMTAYDVTINDFEIDGNLGSDGDGQADTYDYTLTYDNNDYSIYCKRVWDAQDPSVNHIYIVNTIDNNITHNIDTSTEDDLDTISNLSGVTQVHYLLFALAGGVKPTNAQIQNVTNSYLSLIDSSDINVTLSNLNTSFTAITSNLPPNELTYKSLDIKQNNLTGDTENFQEHLTFGNSSFNNYIGNYANLYDIENNSFILANNVFYGSNEYINNTFGNACFNNSFDDDCTENIIGNYFYNNITDDDFDQNLIGNYFYNNYITANFQRNEINYNFYNNTITNGSFYRNDINNDFNNNIIINGDFQNNEIGNQFNNNKLEQEFYKNTIGNGYNNNRIFGEYRGNKVGNGHNDNLIYCQFRENSVSDYFENNTLGQSTNLGGFSFEKNIISFNFNNNTTNGDFSYNHIGSYFYSNIIGDGFGFGFNTSQGNVIGNYFYNNNIGEYFYNNVISDGFYYNTILDDFQLNDVKFTINNTDFTSSTHVYGNYNCQIFRNSSSSLRLSYYDGSDVLNITNITD